MAALDKALALAPDSFDDHQHPRQRAAQAQPRRRRGRGLRARAGARAALPRRARQSRQCAGAARPFRRGARALRRAAGGAARASRDCWSIAAARLRASAASRRRSTAYDRALALRPDYGKARIGRGAALAALNRHQDALPGIRHRARHRQKQCRHPAQRGAVAADAWRLPPRLPEIRGALAAHRHAAPQEPRQAALARRISARAQDHPRSRRAGARRHHPVRALCAAARARAAPRSCSRCRRSWSRCCPASTASRAWSRAATRCLLTMCIAPPAACRWRCAPMLRPFPPTCRISRRTRSAWRNGASASGICRRRASRWRGRAAPTTPMTATARSR